MKNRQAVKSIVKLNSVLNIAPYPSGRECGFDPQWTGSIPVGAAKRRYDMI